MKNQKHWSFENYVQRMTRKEWQKILLADDDRLIVAGRLRTLQAKNIGFGIVEVSKKPL